ncbi:MAG: RNA methyltransferase [Rhizomicrobium sp.]
MTPVIVLSHPQLGENIGAAARAMANFGLSELRLVNPQCQWPNDRALAMAVTAKAIVEEARVFGSLAEALGDLHLVYATTARERGVTKEVLTPGEAARRLRGTADTRTAILFGNERAGLENEEISLCDAVITIPTSGFASINLGQAVLIAAYEWARAADATPPARIEHAPWHRAPTRAEMFKLFAHLEHDLTESGFLFPPTKRDGMIRAIRAMLHRARLTYQETQTIRGMLVALTRGKYRGEKTKDVKDA